MLTTAQKLRMDNQTNTPTKANKNTRPSLFNFEKCNFLKHGVGIRDAIKTALKTIKNPTKTGLDKNSAPVHK